MGVLKDRWSFCGVSFKNADKYSAKRLGTGLADLEARIKLKGVIISLSMCSHAELKSA